MQVKKAILEGDWAEVEKFCNKSPIKSMKSFLFFVYKVSARMRTYTEE